MTESEQPSDLDGTIGQGAEVYQQLASPELHLADRGVVPSLQDQLADGSLAGEVQSGGGTEAVLDRPAGSAAETLTEAQAVQGLQSFLQDFVNQSHPEAAAGDEALAQRAQDLLDNLTYISEHELNQACIDIAADWQKYLETDPDARIYVWSRPNKSSQYVLDHSLANIDPNVAAQRISPVSDLRKYYPAGERPALPTNYRIVMVDDWMATGRQLKEAYQTDISYPWPYDEPPRAEIQLVVTSERQQQEGLSYNDGIDSGTLPVHGVFRARTMANGEPCITGFHSSTDDGFEIPIAAMVESLRTNHGRGDAVMPPLTNIVRRYRMSNSDN